MVDLFEKIVGMLPDPEDNKESPVLFIDEANLLKNLDNNEERKSLINFFNWITRGVKEELPGKNNLKSNKKKIQIVMSSSDQFFLKWIEKQIGSRTEPIVVGDLDEQEASAYFDSYALQKSFPFDNNSFKECFEIAGNIHFFR